MDVLERITDIRLQKGWTEYELAEKSGLTQSTISSWYRKNMLPTLPSLERICSAFDMPMSQFFIEATDVPVVLNDSQKRLLEYAVKLSPNQFEALVTFLKEL